MIDANVSLFHGDTKTRGYTMFQFIHTYMYEVSVHKQPVWTSELQQQHGCLISMELPSNLGFLGSKQKDQVLVYEYEDF